MPRRTACPEEAVVDFIGLAMFKWQDVHQPEEADSKTASVRVAVGQLMTSAVSLRFPYRFKCIRSLEEDNSLLAERPSLSLAVHPIFKQQVGCVSPRL